MNSNMNFRDHVNKARISMAILTLMQAGMTLPEAFDQVMGEGAYRKLADEVWETLNGK